MLPPSLAVLLCCGLAAGYEDLIVRTSSGPVHGYVHVSRAGDNYYIFAGMPYARPPVGQLRFMPPQPVEPWKNVKEVRKHGPLCPQVHIENIYFNGPPRGDEDCLYLSVYTKNLTAKAPVLIHIHAGAWILGDGPSSEGAEFLMDANIVVVDINYRIGILGFLSFEDSILPGNMGLKDQVMALKWVKDNIGMFGGDPDQVTLMGECTGGDSVYHHMISPMSRGLFHRGIAESGSSFAVMAVTPPGLAKERARKLAEMMDCKGDEGQMLACLQKTDGLELTSKILSFVDWQVDPVLTFGPVLEADSPDAFLVGPISKWVPPNVPLLTGITSGEGLLRTLYFTKNFDITTLNNDSFNSLMPGALMIKYTSSNPEELLPKIREFYLQGNDVSMDVFNNLTDMFGDAWFSYGVLEGAKFSQGEVYMYYFDYVGDVTKSQFFGDKTKAKGAFHTEEALYLWQNLKVPPFKGRDYEISRDIVKMFTNFIMKGNPTPDKEFGLTWVPYNPGENYIAIQANGYTMEKGLLTDRYNFWKSLNFRDKLL